MTPLKLSHLTLSLLVAFILSPPVHASTDDLWARHDPLSSQIVSHELWDTFLNAYVTQHSDHITRVLYGSVTDKDHQALKAYITFLETVDVPALRRDEQFVFWVNLYNAATVSLVLDHYPLKSIRSVNGSFFDRGPWNMAIATVAGQTLSLNDIEHKILRRYWQDPRIHYALNCASLSCPNLQPRAFRSAQKEQMLNQAARAYINHPRGVRIDKGKLYLSSIYKWYREDFGKADSDVIMHLNAYADPKLSARLKSITKVNSYHYDWSLNEAAQNRKGTP